MRAEGRESRPRGCATSEAANISTAIKTRSTIARLSDVLADLDDLAEHVDGAFVVVVRVTGDKHRRRCYLSAKAAENAAHRATERGEEAAVYLAELRPLWRVSAPLEAVGGAGA